MEQPRTPASELIAGVDDATKCPCIGSIMIAGVVADTDTIAEWAELGVKDSKLIARKKRDKLARIIRKTAVATSLREVPPLLIDDKTYNLNMWEMVTVLQIIQNLRRRTRFARVHIDNWEVSETVFLARLEQAICRETVTAFRERAIKLQPRTIRALNLVPEHQADETYTVVGAASILAKSASDRQYDRFRKQYGDFGSGNPGDRKTRAFLRLHRDNPLPIIRTSWKTFRTIRDEATAEDPEARTENGNGNRQQDSGLAD